ncbi:MAG: YdeI/OmpD-associated family protein [Polyangiaceae bacterium]
MSAKKLPKKPAKKPVKSGQSAPKAELAVRTFTTVQALDRWLQTAHAKSPGVWLRLMKKSSATQGIDYPQALEVALSWGWIDGQTKPYDADSWLRKFVPRGARSIWSKINREKALKLIADERMHPSGLEQVRRAQADGRFEAAYDSPRNAKPPADFAQALAQSPRAAAFFETLNGANRYSVLFRVQAPKKAETRERKIRELVAMLERGEKIHP